MPDNSAFRGYRNDQIGIGNEGNTSQVNEPGLYFDPVSEKESEVFHNAAADALVRMGWVRVEFDDEGNRLPTTFGRRPEDSPEVLKLRAELAAAQKALEEKNATAATGKTDEEKAEAKAKREAAKLVKAEADKNKKGEK